MQSYSQPERTKSPSAYLDRLPVRALAVFKLIESILLTNTALYAIVYMISNATRRTNWILLILLFAVIAAYAALTLCDGIGCIGTAMGKSRSARMVANVHGIKTVLIYIGMVLTGISFLITVFSGRLSFAAFLVPAIEVGVMFFVLAYEKRMKMLFLDISYELDNMSYNFHGTEAPTGYAVFFAIVSGIVLILSLITCFTNGGSYYYSGSFTDNISGVSRGAAAASFVKYILFAVSCRIYSNS